MDWNPSGVAILSTYKFGSGRSLEGSAWSLPNLQWLAMHADQVNDLPATVFQPHTDHDRCSFAHLLTHLGATNSGSEVRHTDAVSSRLKGCACVKESRSSIADSVLQGCDTVAQGWPCAAAACMDA